MQRNKKGIITHNSKIMIMKKIALLALSAIFMTGLSLSAQEPSTTASEGTNTENRMPPPGQRMKQFSASDRAERMAKKLELTDAQKAKVQALFESENAEREQIMAKRQKATKAQREQMKAQREEMKKQMEVKKSEHDKALIAIIGQEKFDKWEAEQKERAEKMKEHRSQMKRGTDSDETSTME